MTLQKFKAAYIYSLKKLSGLLIFIPAFVFGGMLIGIILCLLIDRSFSMKALSVGGVDLMTMLVFWGIGLGYFSCIFNGAIASGCSKRTMLTALTASSFTVSAAGSLMISLLSPFIELITGNDSELILEEAYGTIEERVLAGESELAVRLGLFLLCMAFLFLVSMSALVLASFIYRFSARTVAITIVAIIALDIIIIMSMPKVMAAIFEAFIGLIEAFGLEFGVSIGNMTNGTLMSLLFGIIFSFITWLFMSRASAKADPVKTS